MTRQQQYEFVRKLIGNIEGSILEKLDNMPENWDGHELRAFVAARFNHEASGSLITREPRSRRARDYRDTILTNNLKP